MKRRQFLLVSSGGTLAAALPACGDGESTSVGDEPNAAAGSGADGGASAGGAGKAGGAGSPSNAGASSETEGGSGGQADAPGSAGAGGAPAPTCGTTTAPNIEGPFFKVESPQRSNLRVDGGGGTLLTISGSVYGPDCAPLAGALLDFWQADENGDYDTLTYVYRGHQFTDAEGRYELETIVPGRYLNGNTYRPAHIHVKAAGQGTMQLTTQLYFEGDPYNASDPFIEPSLIMSLLEEGSGSLVASFDFVLPAA
jgi:protocatechuate 3,4-dioxygenase beta subunit